VDSRLSAEDLLDDVDEHASGCEVVRVETGVWIVTSIHPRDEPALEEGAAEADELAGAQAAFGSPVDGRHQGIIEAVGVEVQPYAVGSGVGQESCRVVGGVFDSGAAQFGQVASSSVVSSTTPP
jgi:hypothetical protein